ncbi:MAG: flagellar hook assembly protein FlgD [Nitrospinaceae bacterium]
MIPGLTPFPSNTNNTTAPAAGQALGKDDFLKLLVAQLQAQDPLSPMDAQDFSAQLAQFSTLEQITNVNQNLEEIQKFEAALNNSSAINLIGKKIDAPGDTIDYQTGESKTLNYSLPEDAGKVKVDILDSTGKKVTTISVGNQLAGSHQVVWKGIDGQGKPVSPGSYSFQVRAENNAGDDLAGNTFIVGQVTDVVFEDGKSFAIVNGQKLAVSEISRISL